MGDDQFDATISSLKDGPAEIFLGVEYSFTKTLLKGLTGVTELYVLPKNILT